MKADFEPASSAAPKDGDFARYVDDLVNRGYPAPGTVRDAASFDAAGLLKRLSVRLQPDRGIPPGTQPGGDAQWGNAGAGGGQTTVGQRTAANRPAGEPPSAASKYRGIPSNRPTTATGASAPDTLPDLPVLAARATRALAGLASRLLLIVSVIWLALALIADIQFFVNTIPIAMGLLFLSLYLRPGKPKSPSPPRT